MVASNIFLFMIDILIVHKKNMNCKNKNHLLECMNDYKATIPIT